MSRIFASTLNTRAILPDSLRFIRSDLPKEVTESERAWLLDNGIKTVVDLRTDGEREGRPCPLATDARFDYISMPVTGGSTIPPTPDDVPCSYIGMVDDRLMSLVRRLLSLEGGALYFCSAGKDRTGVISAILLYLLGYSREYIIADYLISAERLSPMLTAYAEANPTVDINVITPSERYITEFLDWLTDYLA